MSNSLPEPVQFTPSWQYDAASLPVPVNQYLLQVGAPLQDGGVNGDAIITFGNMKPPVVVANPQGGLDTPGVTDGRLPVVVVGQFSMTISRAREFRDMLSSWLDSLDADPLAGQTVEKLDAGN